MKNNRIKWQTEQMRSIRLKINIYSFTEQPYTQQAITFYEYINNENVY